MIRSNILYFFLFINTFLTGLFNFFIPVYLVDMSYSFSQISFYIAFNSMAFFLFLVVLERLIKRYNMLTLSALTFAAEALYLSAIYFFVSTPYFIPLLGITSGIYLAFFWIIQRLLFFEAVTHKNIGRMFGNVQIFLIITGQVAVAVGAYLLEQYSYHFVYLVSMAIVLVAISLSFSSKGSRIDNYTPITLSELLFFKDKLNSRLMFVIDGFFLYLESHYWLMILFLFTSQDFFKLGLIVIVFSLPFGIAHYYIKNIIDTVDVRVAYVIGVIAYAISWFLRPVFMAFDTMFIQFILLALIFFLSLYFRLIFNKLFFQVAKNINGPKYIMFKSYYTQFFTALCFALVGCVFIFLDESLIVFHALFGLAGIASFLFLTYCPVKSLHILLKRKTPRR